MRWVLGIAFSLLFALSFPFRAGDLQFDVGAAAGWLVGIPLALALRGLRPFQAFGFGLGFGTLAWVGVIFWIWVVVHDFGQANAGVAALAVVLLSASQALFLGTMCGGVAALEARAGVASVVVLPAAWVATEFLRTLVPFGGFPWALLGYSAWFNGPLLQLAAVGGVYLLSFLMMGFASLVAHGRVQMAIGLLAIAHLAGFAVGLRSLPDESLSEDVVRVAVVQGNIPQGRKWDPAFAEQSFETYLEASRLASQSAELDLIVWPEAAVVVSLNEPRHRRVIQDLARDTGALLLVGAPVVDVVRQPVENPSDVRFFNSVWAIAPDGRFVERYDKSHLVPFGEYLPLRSLLGLFVEAVARGAAFSDLAPGVGPRALKELPSFGAERALAPLVCYEAIYPSLVREAARAGGRILVNVTNDAWYGHSSAPHQFLAMAAFRSVETGLPMIRAANTGVSAIVAPNGRVQYQTPIFEERVFVQPVPAPLGATLYVRWGNWVVWLSWATLAVVVGASFVGKRSRCKGDAGRASGSR